MFKLLTALLCCSIFLGFGLTATASSPEAGTSDLPELTPQSIDLALCTTGFYVKTAVNSIPLGTVLISHGAISCTPQPFPSGTTIKLFAMPSPGFAFQGWFDLSPLTCPCTGSTSTVCIFTIAATVGCKAVFN